MQSSLQQNSLSHQSSKHALSSALSTSQSNNQPQEGSPAPSATALLVSGSPQGVGAELLRSLAEQVSFILAVDAGAEQLLAAGLVPDMLLGDLDSLSPDTLALLQGQDVPVQGYDAYKNATDLELGLEYLSRKGFCRVIASNVLGGRTDHSLGSLAALAGAVYNSGLDVCVRDAHEACYILCGSTQNQVLELDFETLRVLGNGASPLAPSPDPEHISLIAWGGSATVSLQGVEWPLDHHRLSPYSALGVSNLLRASVLRLEVHENSNTVLLLLSY